MKIARLVLIIFLLASLLANIYLFRQLQFLQKQQQQLRQFTHRLRTERKQLENRLRLIKLQEETAEIRELAFLKPVVSETISKQQLQEFLREEMEEEFLEDKPISVYQKTMEKFGLLRPGQDLESFITGLYEEQVQGMYDEKNKQMIMVANPQLTDNLQNMMLEHELTHALQDQHFNLESIPIHDDNEDRALAALALVEGDATISMFIYYKKNLRLFRLLWDMTNYLAIDQSQIRNSPYALRENLLFSYKSGLKFVTLIYQTFGWPGVNKVYSRVPESTEQVLHPRKYLADNDPPQTVLLPDRSEALTGWKKLETNTMGEFNIRVLLAMYLGEVAALTPSAGWGGDSWEVWENPATGNLRLIWHIEWDTEKDAREFFTAYRKVIRKLKPVHARLVRRGKRVMIEY